MAAQYGYADGSNGVTVSALNNQACPDGQTNCFRVTVVVNIARVGWTLGSLHFAAEAAARYASINDSASNPIAAGTG